MREVVDTEQAFEQAVFDYQTVGYEVVEKAQGRAVLKRGLRGDWIWHVPLFIFTLGVGNIAYLFYRWFNRPEKLVVRRRMAPDEGAVERTEKYGEDGRRDGE